MKKGFKKTEDDLGTGGFPTLLPVLGLMLAPGLLGEEPTGLSATRTHGT